MEAENEIAMKKLIVKRLGRHRLSLTFACILPSKHAVTLQFFYAEKCKKIIKHCIFLCGKMQKIIKKKAGSMFELSFHCKREVQSGRGYKVRAVSLRHTVLNLH